MQIKNYQKLEVIIDENRYIAIETPYEWLVGVFCLFTDTQLDYFQYNLTQFSNNDEFNQFIKLEKEKEKEKKEEEEEEISQCVGEMRPSGISFQIQPQGFSR
ncbi:MAG: hypothetical protein ACYTBJ_24925 [Planctomycetota bacterium]|jgi:hypothetical protein